MRATALLLALLAMTAAFAGCMGAGSGDDGGGGPDAGDGGDGAKGGSGVDIPTGGDGSGGSGDDGGAAAPSMEAPDWNVGDYWVYRIDTAEYAPQTTRLALYEDDGEHYYLGSDDRDHSLGHALYSWNPMLGRIHYGSFAPHEEGGHSAMFYFPLEDGKRWQGYFYSHFNQFDATYEALAPLGDGTAPGYRIVATNDTGFRVEYTYVPEAKWFTELVATNVAGETVAEITLLEWGSGYTGEYWFHRGRDRYAGPQGAYTPVPDGGVLLENFTAEEDPRYGTYHFILGKVHLVTNGTVTLTVRDPAGEVRYNKTVTQGAFTDDLVVVDGPIANGEWAVTYTGVGALQSADVRWTGVYEYGGTL